MRLLIVRRGALLASALMLALLVAGCGGLVGAGGDTGDRGVPGAPAATATTGAPLPCTGAPAASEGTPAVILRNTSGPKEAAVQVGQIVEIRLDGHNKWGHDSIDPESALMPAGAQGALEDGDCVWDFRVAQASKTVVTFVGGALCQPNEACPQYAILAAFTING
jgi:hypothetical protein